MVTNIKNKLIIFIVALWFIWFWYVTGINYTPAKEYTDTIFYYLAPIYIYASYKLLVLKRKEITKSQWKNKSEANKRKWYIGYSVTIFTVVYLLFAFHLYFLPNTIVDFLSGKYEEKTVQVSYINSRSTGKSCRGTSIEFNTKYINKICFWSQSLTDINVGDNMLLKGRVIFGGFLVDKVHTITSQSSTPEKSAGLDRP